MNEDQHYHLQELARLIRYYILVSTTAAGSGHPTSCLSAVDVMTTLMFGGFFKADLNNPQDPNNDRLIFSKGHASPLLYALYAAAGKLTEQEIVQLRKIDSPLEGHPTPRFKYSEAATGSLGQGLGIGAGMALNAKLDKLDYKTYVLLGDGEMAEGSVWEAMEIATHYKLNNLVAILDVNGWGTGKTIHEHDLQNYVRKAEAFGWEAIEVNGHDIEEINEVFESISHFSDQPVMIVAKTKKGAGIGLEEGLNLHGKALSQEQMEAGLKYLGEVNKELVGEVAKPKTNGWPSREIKSSFAFKNYELGEQVATREAYGQALAELAAENPDVLALDADLSPSTFSARIKEVDLERFLEMYIAEQNMVSVGTGLALRGKVPFCSSFAAFLTRAYDQIRMGRYSEANVKFCGSHCGVSIGEDGFSQMGLEDLAMFRPILDAAVVYPSDAVSAKALTKTIAKYQGLAYIRTSRPKTSVIYAGDEQFPLGGSKTLKSSASDQVTVIAAGVTLHEALRAYEELQKEGIHIRVIDLYSVKPVDVDTLLKANQETKALIVVEDHYREGGLYSTVCEVLGEKVSSDGRLSPIHSLAVTKVPRSGSPAELLAYVEIDAKAIVKQVKDLLK